MDTQNILIDLGTHTDYGHAYTIATGRYADGIIRADGTLAEGVEVATGTFETKPFTYIDHNGIERTSPAGWSAVDCILRVPGLMSEDIEYLVRWWSVPIVESTE